ncbi:MAG: ABC transporter permease [Bacillota bacterium]|jgi:ABC-2 type transport system permease protein|nr:ABC transporter permease [Bacillota bacterium]HHU30859.1 ABC transporter permease [Bacillota bacterium]
MQVFKLCLRVLKKNIPSLLIYVVIFLVISLIMALAHTNEQEDALFSPSKSNIVFLSAEETPLVRGLKEELGKVANFVELPDDAEALQDALFFREVSYILRVPEGFSERFMNGEDVQLEKTIVPDSFGNAYLDLKIDQYLNSARLYVEQIEDLSQESLVQYLKSDLSADTPVELKTNGVKAANHVYTNYYFNYLAYSMLAVLILGTSALMLVYHDQDLQRRNACSPLSPGSFNRQFFLAILAFTGLTWFLMVIFCFLFNFKNLVNINAVFFVANSFVFAVCAAGISFLVGNMVKSESSIPAVSNVLTLGLAFISGVFVPAELLGSLVLKVASFTPTYWYVAANNRIAALASFNYASLQPVFSAMLIQAGFALAFIAIALVLGKKRRLE